MGDERLGLAQEYPTLASDMQPQGSTFCNGSVSLPPRKRLLVGLKHSNSATLVCSNGFMTSEAGLSQPNRGEEEQREECSSSCVRCGGIEICSRDSPMEEELAWFNCSLCPRSVHVRCELEMNPSSALLAANYVCPRCNLAEDTYRQAYTDGDGSEKKLKTGGEEESYFTSPCSENGSNCDAPVRERTPEEEVFEAAKLAADKAARAAGEARDRAAALALAAAKAAMVAKNALDRAAASAREELGLATGIDYSYYHQFDNGNSNGTRNKNGVRKGKTTQENDEELARQLHRAMNSSTRNARKI